MPVLAAQPIAGVSSNRETEIEVIYPSVASGVVGRLAGAIMGAAAATPFLPLRLLVMVIVGALLGVPLGLLAYALTRLFGNCYVLTNRSIRARSIVGAKSGPATPLADIAGISIARRPSYKFHRVGDLNLENAQGDVLMTIPAIPYPERLRQVIVDAREARLRSDESLAAIQKRTV